MAGKGPYGYESEAAFMADVEREIKARSIHDSGNSRQQPKPKPTKLQGRPNSPERLRQVARAAGVDTQTFLNTVTRDAAGKKLVRAVAKLSKEGYDREALEEAAELTVEIQSEDVAKAAMNALPPEIAQRYYGRMVEIAEGRDTTAEEERVAERQALLADEYEWAGRQVDTVDAIAHSLPPETIYDEMSEDEVRILLRSGAIQAESETAALSTFATHAALDDEFKKVGAPGSSWTDPERERWEAEMQAGSMKAYDDKRLSVDSAVEAAAESLEPQPTFVSELNKELDKLSTPPAHQQRLRDLNVEDWEQTEGRRLRGE